MRQFLLLLCLLAGCRTTNTDRLPATAANNPDPLFGGNSKLREPSTPNEPAVGGNAVPTSQRSGGNDRPPPSADRIGPLQFQPRNAAPIEPATSGMPPSPAVLTTQIKEPRPEPVKDSQVQPAQVTQPVSSPQVVQEYRQRMNQYGVAGLRTKTLSDGTWEAVGHFPAPAKPDQLRRIEAHGATEADALLAILEQLQKAK